MGLGLHNFLSAGLIKLSGVPALPTEGSTAPLHLPRLLGGRGQGGPQRAAHPTPEPSSPQASVHVSVGDSL